ncbi:PHD finger domain-containing protein [Phaeosphaeriaceae sp. PMI808]|nr:PHD finger domain-containing protein [Phaeosphaeriaceae sp. PMI808]
MPPTAGTRTSTRQGRTTGRPTNYYARNFAGRLAASGLEQTPEASNSAPGFLPALTHFTAAVDALPKEMIKHFSMFKEVEAKLHDPEQMLKHLFDEIAQLPTTTKGQLRNGKDNIGAPEGNSSLVFDALSPEEEQTVVRKRQLFYRVRMLLAQIIPTLDEKHVVLQATKVTKDKGLMRMHHSYSQLDREISDEARYGSLTHWAYADKEERKKGGTNHERQRREVAAANNLAAAAQHVLEVDSIAAKSEARREAMLAKRSRHHQADSDFDDRPAKKPQKRKPLPADVSASDNRNTGLGISNNNTGPHKRKKTEKALAAAAPAAPPMERSLSGTLKVAGGGGGGGRGESPRATPVVENGTAPKRKPRAAPAPAQRKHQLPPYSPPLASPQAANFSINKTIAAASDRPLSARARKNSIANSVASVHAQDASNARRPSSSHSIQQQATNGNAITELEQAAGIVHDTNSVHDVPTPKDIPEVAQPLELLALKQEEHVEQEPESMDIDIPIPGPLAGRVGRTSKTATPIVGSFPEIPMARSRSARNANNSNSNASSENNSTTTGSVSKRINKKNPQSALHAALASSAIKSTSNVKSNPPSSAASSVAADQENEYQEAESDEDGDEPRYCYCNQVSYGSMVACDNDHCPREWFHIPCVNLEKVPAGRTKWFCSDECKDMHAKAKAKGGRPGSSRQ